MYEVFLETFHVPGGGPDQLNRGKDLIKTKIIWNDRCDNLLFS